MDNWSVGVKGGVTTPMTHSAFWKNSRPAMGVELSKQITPVLSLGTSFMGYINTSSSKTAFDASNIELLSKFNMMNLFGGYPGTPLFGHIPLREWHDACRNFPLYNR